VNDGKQKTLWQCLQTHVAAGIAWLAWMWRGEQQTYLLFGWDYDPDGGAHDCRGIFPSIAAAKHYWRARGFNSETRGHIAEYNGTQLITIEWFHPEDGWF
jgi:hypothetical protein